jgi:nitroreductase
LYDGKEERRTLLQGKAVIHNQLDTMSEPNIRRGDLALEFNKLIEARYSVRAYKSDPVSDEVLQQVLEAARLAPTACNRQPYCLIVLHTEGRQEELRRLYPREWFVQPPLIVGICVQTSEAWVRSSDGKCYADVDAAIAMDHLILAAASLGLGTCWIAAFDPTAAREILGLPDGVEPIAFTPLGYPADTPGAKKRKRIEEMVRYEHW